jgi:hypothetical protein
MTTCWFARLRLLRLALACAALSALAQPALCQPPADDHAGDMGMISVSHSTDADGNLVATVKIAGSLGEVTFTLRGKEAEAAVGSSWKEASMDMAVLRKHYYANARQSFGATGEEWKVLGPKIEKVRRLKTALSSRGKYGGLPGATADLNTAWKAMTPLLAKKDAKQDELKAALKAVYDAEAAVNKELAEAEKDLRGLLTIKQEALLVQNQLLD